MLIQTCVEPVSWFSIKVTARDGHHPRTPGGFPCWSDKRQYSHLSNAYKRRIQMKWHLAGCRINLKISNVKLWMRRVSKRDTIESFMSIFFISKIIHLINAWNLWLQQIQSKSNSFTRAIIIVTLLLLWKKQKLKKHSTPSGFEYKQIFLS
jgi:hypothetical protein